MEIRPIWISSINHLNDFNEIRRTTPYLRKLIGFYKIPKDFPRLRSNYINKIPTVYFSNGEISLEDNILSYKSYKKKNNFFLSYSNLMNDLSFKIKTSDIKSVQWYKHKNALINYYNIKWIRINCNENLLGGDFLICVGGNGPSVNKITTNTENLFEMLNQIIKS